MNTKTWGLAGILALPLATAAQDKHLIDSSQKANLEEVIVNSLRATTKSPFAYTNLSEQEILDRNEGKDIPYLLDHTPSVLVNSDAGNGVGYTDIRLRGSDATRINMTINGIPINDAESQGLFFVNFPDVASSSNSVQVQRGVGSSTNGAGAFGGSINVSNIEQKDEAHVRLSNSYGSFNTLRHSLTAGTGRLKNGFNVDVRLSKINSDGYIQRSASNLKSLQLLTGWSSQDSRTKFKFNLFTGTQTTGQAWNGVAQEMLTTNRRFNELGIKEDGTFYKNQTDNYQQDYYQLFGEHRFNSHWNLNGALFLTRGKGFYDEYRQGESYSSYHLPNPIVGNDTISETSLTRQLWLDNYFYGTVLNLRYHDERSQWNVGGAVTQYDGQHYGQVNWASNGHFPQAYRWYELPASKRDANIYIKTEQKLAKHWYGTVDLQLRSVNYQINGFRKNPSVKHNLNYLFFNPKMGISFIKDLQKAFLSVAVANKEPNRDDFEAGIANTPKPERMIDLELGYQQAYTSGANWTINAYWMQYKDQLILTGKINDVGAYARENVTNSHRTGVELSGYLPLGNQFSIDGNATLSQNKIKTFTEYIDDYDLGGQLTVTHNNTDIALSPNVIAQAGINWKPTLAKENQELSFGLNGKYVSRQYLDNTSNEARSITPFALANARVQYKTACKPFKSMMLIGSVNNLLNKKYETKGYTYSYIADGLQTYNYYFPQAGTNFSATLVLEW